MAATAEGDGRRGPPAAVIARGDITERLFHRPRLWHLAAVVLGIGLLALMLQRVGVGEVRRGFASVGPWFLAVLTLGGLRFAARAQSWVCCASTGESRLRFRDALAILLSADALGNLTPLGLIASEPAKVMLVRRQLPVTAAVASIAIDNFFYTASVFIVIATGTLLFLQRPLVPDAFDGVNQLVAAGVLFALAAGAWLAWRRVAVLTQLARVAVRLGRRAEVPAERVEEVKARIEAAFSWPAGRTLTIAAWQAAFHALAVAEVFLLLHLLPGGDGASLLDAFLLESAGRLIVVVFKFVPYRLGVDEAGSALVAQTLALDPTVGVTLALARKLRILCWNAVGIALLARRGAARLRA